MTVPLIIDTDPGVDDAFAIALTAASPEAELLTVTTTFGNVDLATTTANARRVLGLLGRDDVPVGRGAEVPLVHPVSERAEHVHGDDGLGGCAADFAPLAPEPVGPAQDLLVRTLEAAREPVTIAAIGPFTNIALLLATRPDLAERIGRLVVMGGDVGTGGNVTRAAEFNVWSDPEAARRVLVEEPALHGLAVTVVPLDLTHAVGVDRAWLTELAESGPVGAALAATRLPFIEAIDRGEVDPEAGPGRAAIHDALTLLEAIVPGTLATTALDLEVDCSLGPARGALLADRRGRPTVTSSRVALPTSDGAVDPEVLRAELLARLSAAPTRGRA